jgi:hypothetical protein
MKTAFPVFDILVHILYMHYRFLAVSFHQFPSIYPAFLHIKHGIDSESVTVTIEIQLYPIGRSVTLTVYGQLHLSLGITIMEYL